MDVIFDAVLELAVRAQATALFSIPAPSFFDFGPAALRSGRTGTAPGLIGLAPSPAASDAPQPFVLNASAQR